MHRGDGGGGGRGRAEPTPPECALAAEMFDHFCAAGTMKQILTLHREICNTLTLRPNRLPDFYPKLKAKLASSWKAQALFKKFDARAAHKVYGKGRLCCGSKVLIIGAGPCGLRAAIECQLLGAKVVVIEKRDRMSRNNVLHLWPFVIQDLRALGAKKFFGKFCAGAIDHISIRQLQCILLKVALLLGVEFHEGVSFEELLEPTSTEKGETLGWRARVLPEGHAVAQFEFDALLGADGKRNTLNGFKRSEFRGKLAMAITANFINRHSEMEAAVPEISGVAFIFNQKFFKQLHEVTGIDLENIVYYKDDTHYFVMTAKKHSLLDKGVLLQDFAEVSRLLSAENVDRLALMRYAQEAARFSTGGRLPLRDFALNHYGEPDVALFDFTSMYAAENASMVYERLGRRLLCQLVGDSLLEPFWPTGSGCARGFLSALDAAWAVRSWALQLHPLLVLAERESVYRLLAQTTPENLHRDVGAYTLDPGTRYPNLNRAKVSPAQVAGFLDSDDPTPVPLPADALLALAHATDAPHTARKRRRDAEVSEEALVAWVHGEAGATGGLRGAASAAALCALVRRYRPDLLPKHQPPAAVYAVLHHEFGITPAWSATAAGPQRDVPDVPDAKLRAYLARVYAAFKGEVPHVHHETNMFEQIKQSQAKEKHGRNSADHTLAMYSSAAEADKSTSSYRKKRRAGRCSGGGGGGGGGGGQVSESAELLRRGIGQLRLDDVAQLARLLDGRGDVHGAGADEIHQRLHDQILSLLQDDDAMDPQALRDSIAAMLQGTTKSHISDNANDKLGKFFGGDTQSQSAPARPPRKLKGLDADSIRVVDLDDLSDPLDDVTLKQSTQLPKDSKKEKQQRVFHVRSVNKPFVRSLSVDTRKPLVRAASVDGCKPKAFVRSSSVDTPAGENGRAHSPSPEPDNTKRIVQLFERLTPHRASPSPEGRRRASAGAGAGADVAERAKRMAEILDGASPRPRSPERPPRASELSTPLMALRRQRVIDLIEGTKPIATPDASRDDGRRALAKNRGEIALRVARATELVQRKREESKRARGGGAGAGGGGRRRAQRDITRQRFERSLQMLTGERDGAGEGVTTTSDELRHDVGLAQYRASAPRFGERVRRLERQLQHQRDAGACAADDSRSGTGGSRGAGGVGGAGGGGARVARLAAELAGGAPHEPVARHPSKPKDLMRSVGKIERDDWNVRQIERKITQNRLGRPEPRLAERVPKWDREQFLGRQRRLREGDASDEKWGEIDETLTRLDRKLRDAGRPDHGTNKVASLATKFVKKEGEEPPKPAKEAPAPEQRRSWQGAAASGATCAACGARVFAAEGVCADGLALHRKCFRCAVCKAVLRPGNYTMERYGTRLVCLRHSGAVATDGGPAGVASGVASGVTSGVAPGRQPPPATPERISLELSDGAREIDEDEWTDRNCLASETSGAGGLSDEDSSSSESLTDAVSGDSGDERDDSPSPGGGHAPSPRPHALDAHHARAQLYFSDDSFGYDDYSDDGAESSGNESCSRMRAAREARRREVPRDARPPTDSSEVESEEESESSDSVSSATEVSTDSEFARDECAPAADPPAILVTEPPPPVAPPMPVHAPAPVHAPTPADYPLSRTRSAGGLATKRALELKRRYLLGEPSPPAVRKSDSTSQLDTKLEAFRSNITEFQKMLHPAPLPAATAPRSPIAAFRLSEEPKVQPPPQPMPDIIKNLCDAPVDLLPTNGQPQPQPWRDKEAQPEPKERDDAEPEIDSDSLSDEESSHTHTAPAPPPQPPRLEVHDDSGELIQLDSLMLQDSAATGVVPAEDVPSMDTTETPTTVESAMAAEEHESSESERDATTLALTETELSDWAGDSAVLDDVHEPARRPQRSQRTLNAPKRVPACAGANADIDAHVCGLPRDAPTSYRHAIETFAFADDGEQDPSLEAPPPRRNEGYMELVDDDFDLYSPGNDRSMNFIERSFSETVLKPAFSEPTGSPSTPTPTAVATEQSSVEVEASANEPMTPTTPTNDSVLQSASMSMSSGRSTRGSSTASASADRIDTLMSNGYDDESTAPAPAPVSLSELSPPLAESEAPTPRATPTPPPADTDPCSPPLTHTAPLSAPAPPPPLPAPTPIAVPVAPASPAPAPVPPPSLRLFSPAICRSASETFARAKPSPIASPVAPTTTDKVQEIKREREVQTELVRWLVLQRMGGAGGATASAAQATPARRSARRRRSPPLLPPPPPPPPVPPPPAPPRPAPPLAPLPVTPSFSDPELAREIRRKSIMKSISNYLNRRLGPRHKEASAQSPASAATAGAAAAATRRAAHKSTGALADAAPPVPPPPAGYCPPHAVAAPAPAPPTLTRQLTITVSRGGGGGGGGASRDASNDRDAMQLLFEARWARPAALRRARDTPAPDASAGASTGAAAVVDGHARRLARLERRLTTRPLSAEQQAATVAELVQVSAQRDAHQALMAHDRRRSGAGVAD